MFTWGSKYLLGIATAAFLAAATYGLTTGGTVVGVSSMGYKGGVGEHTGYTILMALAFVSLFLGVVNVITRDGDAEETAALIGSDHMIAVRPPSGLSPLGPLTAFGIACLAIGIAIGMVFFYLGIAVLFVVGLQWLVQAWADRATGDAEVNAVIRNRILAPMEVPMMAMLTIAVVALALSRIMLAVSEIAATVVAVAVAAFIFVAAILIVKSKAPRAVVTSVVTFGVAAVLAGGVISAVVGERELHHDEEGEHSEETSDAGSVEGVGE